jgi:hypothetical protein
MLGGGEELMTTTRQREICNKTSDLVQEKISLREFESWFVPATWNLHLSNDPDAQALADAIDLNISEYTSGLLTQDELRKELAAAIRPFELKARAYRQWEQRFPMGVESGNSNSVTDWYRVPSGNSTQTEWLQSEAA